jgi:protein-S-isoprenylcysteine O-methyltransferase Ste14
LAIPARRLSLDLGILFLLMGTVFRQYSIRILGKYFTAAVVVLPLQPVIDKGPYKYIRHPGYTGGFIMYLGIGLALGSFLSLLIFIIDIL